MGFHFQFFLSAMICPQAMAAVWACGNNYTRVAFNLNDASYSVVVGDSPPLSGTIDIPVTFSNSSGADVLGPFQRLSMWSVSTNTSRYGLRLG